MRRIIGVDIGGTSIKAGLVAAGRIVKKTAIKTKAKMGKAAVIKNIISSIERLMNKDVAAIGIGSPGPLNYKSGVIYNTPNLPLKNVNLKKIIKNKFKKPVFIDNDANCFTLAEALYGAGKNSNVVVGLTLGTGIGGGIVINKKIYHGKGNAGELGHITINFNGPKTKCGNNGCIESYCSAKGILNRVKGVYIKNPKELAEVAEKGNKTALKVLEDTGFYLGVGLANIINALDPDILIIDGKISNAWEFFSKKMFETIKKRAFSSRNTKIVRSKLKDAGIIGAALVAMKS